jgi:hypothetical protein
VAFDLHEVRRRLDEAHHPVDNGAEIVLCHLVEHVIQTILGPLGPPQACSRVLDAEPQRRPQHSVCVLEQLFEASSQFKVSAR